MKTVTDMKTVTARPAFQGDVMLVRINDQELPTGLVAVSPEGGHLIVTHSETGHHHTIDVVDRAAPVEMYRLPEEIYEAFLVVSGDRPAVLEHRRPFDTHEPLALPPGVYRVRRQREYTPEGYRRAAD